MKRSKFFTILFLLVTVKLSARQFYFSKANYQDSSAFASAMPKLAQELLVYEQEEIAAPSFSDYDNWRKYTLVAGYYQQSNDYLDTCRKLMRPDSKDESKAIGIQSEAFATTKLLQKSSGRPFSDLFTDVFGLLFSSLNDNAKILTSSYINADIPELRKNLETQKSEYKKSDSLNAGQAANLVKAYGALDLFSQTRAIMMKRMAEYDLSSFIIQREMIKVRDGSTLQAIIVRRKDAKGKLPAVFIFNIYQDSTRDATMAKRYAIKGFVGVVVNTRGKGASPQSVEPFEHDANDAYDAIEWISKQKWSNKKVGMVGGSYLGFTQWAAVKRMHPALKTIMPQVAVGIGIDYPCYGNIFFPYMLRWIHYVTNNKGTDETDFNDEARWDKLSQKWYASGASFRSLDTLDGRLSPIFQRWLQHPSFDSYWQNMTTCGDEFARINIPVLTTTGYYDADQIGALYYFKEHYAHNPGADHYLVIGPYDHFGAQRYPGTEVDGYRVDSVATSFNFVDLSIQWFNYTLKGGPKPALLKDKVNYQVMGANVWKHASSISAMSNRNRRLYLSNIRVNGDYKLLDSAATIPEYIIQEVDMADRTDTVRKYYSNIDDDINRKNLLTFISKPLPRAVMMNGAFTAQLKLAINKKDADLVVNLYELMPDGKYFYLSDAMQRASYARDRRTRVLLRPGEKVSIPITNAGTTSRLLQKGSRFVITVGIRKSSNSQINYGTGKDVSDETIKDAGEPFNIKWFTDSYIDIPLWE